MSIISHPPISKPQPPATTNLRSVSIDLSVLDIPCKWDHTPCGLLSLASFTRIHVFEVPCVRALLPFCG